MALSAIDWYCFSERFDSGLLKVVGKGFDVTRGREAIKSSDAGVEVLRPSDFRRRGALLVYLRFTRGAASELVGVEIDGAGFSAALAAKMGEDSCSLKDCR